MATALLLVEAEGQRKARSAGIIFVVVVVVVMVTLNSSLTIMASSTSEAGKVVVVSLPGSLIPSKVAFFSISKSWGFGGGFFSKFLHVKKRSESE